MSETEEAPLEIEEKKKSPIMAIVFSAAGVIAMGAAATGATYFLAPGSDDCAVAGSKESHAKDAHGAVQDVTFINMEPLVVTLGANARSRYLKISISLETIKSDEKTLIDLTPKIRDTLNSYLRAVEEADLVRPAAMTRLRAQMLRRVQLIAPAASVEGVLITDFILT